jgi:hypothetical protein
LVLTGPSNPPDAEHYAYRKDLADVSLAGEVIASHYAEPLPRQLGRREPLRAAASEQAQSLGELDAGEPFELLDNSLGWAWGYAGSDRRVGYVKSEALKPV